MGDLPQLRVEMPCNIRQMASNDEHQVRRVHGALIEYVLLHEPVADDVSVLVQGVEVV